MPSPPPARPAATLTVPPRERRNVRLLFAAALGLLILAEAAGGLGWLPPPHRLLHLDPNAYSPFFAFAVGNLFCVHLLLAPQRLPLLAAAAVGVILFALLCALLQPAWAGALPWLGLAAYCLGLGSLALLGLRTLIGRADADARFALQAGLLPVVFVMLSWPFLEATHGQHPISFDGMLWHFEASLGWSASVAGSRLFALWPALAGACVTIYCALPLAVGTVHAQQCRHLPKAPAMHGFVGAGVLGSALYLTYPAAGPRYLFGSAFPLQLPPLAAIPAAPAAIAPAFLNAMPSLHMTWALLLYFGSRTLPPPLRLASTGFAVLTALATLGMGEHYLVDLALAFPLALLVHELGHARRPRVVGASLLALAAWLGYLRWGVPLFATVGLWHWPALLATAWLALRAGISAAPQSMSMPTTIPPTNSHLQA